MDNVFSKYIVLNIPTPRRPNTKTHTKTKINRQPKRAQDDTRQHKILTRRYDNTRQHETRQDEIKQNKDTYKNEEEKDSEDKDNTRDNTKQQKTTQHSTARDKALEHKRNTTQQHATAHNKYSTRQDPVLSKN